MWQWKEVIATQGQSAKSAANAEQHARIAYCLLACAASLHLLDSRPLESFALLQVWVLLLANVLRVVMSGEEYFLWTLPLLAGKKSHEKEMPLLCGLCSSALTLLLVPWVLT